MNRQEKDQFIDSLTEKLNNNKNFYLTDLSGLSVGASNDLRRSFFKQGITLQVVKNTLLKKAMEKAESDYAFSYDSLKGNTAITFTESGNVPAKVIKKFRKTHEKPLIKVAFIEESHYIGDEQLNNLASLKSKNELIADIIFLLQSPANNIISALQSGGNTLSGVLKALSEKSE